MSPCLKLITALASLATAAPAWGQSVSPDVAHITEARRRATGVWPGFDPAAIPALLFDGTNSWLSGHPSTPEGFRPAGQPGLQVFSGRHPEITANSTVELGGVITATIMPFRPELTAAERAGVVAHEMFHAYTRRRHTGWTANEVDAFTWPVTDAEVLALRRVEYQQLRGALAAADSGTRRCWARGALRTRRERYARMSATSAAYERNSEIAEGLADYVQMRVAGVTDTGVMPPRPLAPADVRDAAYATGDGLARLLDDLRPGWRDTLEQRDSLRLDEMLEGAIAGATLPHCTLDSDVERQLRVASSVDIGALQSSRDSTRRALEQRPGWRITVLAGAEPLWPQRFDPLNVGVLDSGLVVHRRMVRLGNGAGTVEVLGHAAITRAAGAHPLFNGLRSLEVTGLPDAPQVNVENGVLTVRSSVMSATLRGASSSLGENHVTIRLP